LKEYLQVENVKIVIMNKELISTNNRVFFCSKSFMLLIFNVIFFQFSIQGSFTDAKI